MSQKGTLREGMTIKAKLSAVECSRWTSALQDSSTIGTWKLWAPMSHAEQYGILDGLLSGLVHPLDSLGI
jgi:hypothetical protein